jgi:hypothetical protein
LIGEKNALGRLKDAVRYRTLRDVRGIMFERTGTERSWSRDKNVISTLMIISENILLKFNFKISELKRSGKQVIMVSSGAVALGTQTITKEFAKQGIEIPKVILK